MWTKKKLKRASLSLSVNAIVILVLAIAMLGLGLGFTKGMFAKFSSKLEVPEPDIPATAEDQIVLPADTINVPKNKEAVFSVNVYNDNWGDEEVVGVATCGTVESLTITPALPQSIPAGTDAMFKFIIPSDSSNTGTSGSHICKLTFGTGTAPDLENTISKQIVVTIK